MKATRTRGTSRAATPNHHRDHTTRAAFAQADAAFGIEGVGMT